MMKRINYYGWACVITLSIALNTAHAMLQPAKKTTVIKREISNAINVASQATPSAEFTAAWNNLYAINNGTKGVGTELPNNETWASWDGYRPATRWIAYEWGSEMTFCGSSIWFWYDRTDLNGGDNVRMPTSYTIQYWDNANSKWVDVTLKEGTSYPLNPTGVNEVEFVPVTTNKLRLFMNASTDGSNYSALGVTEWEAYIAVTEPTFVTEKKNIVVGKQLINQKADINIKGMNIAEEGVTISFEKELNGLTLTPNKTQYTKAEVEAGIDLSFAFDPTAENAKTELTYLVCTSGSTTYKLPVMTSMDEGFTEHNGNQIYDPNFYTLDRLITWNKAPEIVTLAEYPEVKCGATCLKFDASEKTGIACESSVQSTIVQKGLYLTAGENVIHFWINTNGTFDTGIYTPYEQNIVTCTEPNATRIDTRLTSITIPNTNGEWQEFEYHFTLAKDAFINTWVNNDRDKTATLVYLDNWQVYNTGYDYEVKDITEYKDYNITPVNFTQVHLTDKFWKPRMIQNQQVTIPVALEKCYQHGRVDNFKKAAGLMDGYFDPNALTFDDTDIYKILEGMSYSIQVNPNQELSDEMDYLIDLMAQAQEEDGYLYTPRTAVNPNAPHPWMGANRWEWDPNLSHELYNCGHLYEAAYAHYNATGKTTLLDIATKNADLLVKDFLYGGLHYEPGHQIVEMGLVKLYRITGKKEYLALAKYFLDLRGTKGVMRSYYSQSHIPVVAQREAVGHAVRATYMYSGMADIAAMTGNEDYQTAIDEIWKNVVEKKYYITGGIGAKRDGEAFDANYVLPNKEAYCETCASIANVYWNHRLFLNHGEAKYYDVLERSLYNGVISGVGLDGKTFFYPNPLEADGSWGFNQDGHKTRAEWFGCACCPSNLCRFMASVPSYVYACKDHSVYVNLFMQGDAELTLGDGKKVNIAQTTEYPWDGAVKVTVNPVDASNFAVLIRIPGWTQNRPVPSNLYTYTADDGKRTKIKVNGNKLDYTINEEGYVVIERSWNEGDEIDINFPMEIHRVKSHQNVVANQGKMALERGPIVYCIESNDNTTDLSNIAIDENVEINVKDYAINGNAMKALQINAKTSGVNTINNVAATAIPYYAWSNRGVSKMRVWMETKAEAITASPYTFVSNQWTKVDGRSNISYDETNNTLRTSMAGDHNVAANFNAAYDNIYALEGAQKYFLIKGFDFSTDASKCNLWWLNGWNHATSELPIITHKDAEGNCYAVWDITQTAFSADWATGGAFYFKSNGTWNTCFGLTSTAADGSAELNDISFYSLRQLLEKYPELAVFFNCVELDENNDTYTSASGVKNVSLSRTLSADKWNTFCVPFGMSVPQMNECGIIEARELTDVEVNGTQTSLKFSPAEGIVAGKPYLVKVDKDINHIVLEQVTFSDAEPQTISVNGVNMTGNYTKTFVPQDCYFINSNAFYLADQENTVHLKGFRAYITTDDIVKVNSLLIDIDGTLLDINDILKEEEHLIFDVYNLQGVKVRSSVEKSDALNNLSKGIYIINGKKYIK